ncbi:MAG: class I SAM-dependent methyltransferase [Gammaproteobacteria bacterium]|nr:class I SAM-dependent methyltransferase [Gammaproteobacteria bacterium]
MAETPLSSSTGLDATKRRSTSVLNQLARRLILGTFRQLREGTLTIEDGEHTYHFEGLDAGPRAQIQVIDPEAWSDVAFRGSIGAGEAYMAGFWTTPSLEEVTRLFVANTHLTDRMETGMTRAFSAMIRGMHWLNRNTLTGSKRNIEAHYDLGNDLFQTFLDPTLMYSSALYPSTDADLHQASIAKLDHICQKLDLSASDHVLEIGTGWGGFALHAATHYGCRVTTTTISEEQFTHANAQVAASGLADRITVLKQDYRALTGQYDKLVSIEMIEAVGHQFLDTYIKTLSERLKPTGLALIQAITIVEHRYQLAVQSVDFIKRYIFPGGFLPSIGAIMKSMGKTSDLRILHLEDFASHYARTLADWRTRFNARRDDVRALGYDERFCRMWEFYLAYCEGGFAERQLGLAQLLLAKPKARHEVAFSPIVAR